MRTQPWRDDTLPMVPDAWVWSSQKRAAGLTYAAMGRKGYHRLAWAGSVKNPDGLGHFSPYASGDRLWVKETWRIASLMYDDAPIIQYRADGTEQPCDPIDGPDAWDDDKYLEWCLRQWAHMEVDCAKAGIEADLDGIYDWTKETNPNRWRSSRFMPRWASRLTLEVEDGWAEQLQRITAEDCFAEGWPRHLELFPTVNMESKALNWFSSVWDKINAKRGFGFDVNPWVWVTKFALLGGGD